MHCDRVNEYLSVRNLRLLLQDGSSSPLTTVQVYVAFLCAPVDKKGSWATSSASIFLPVVLDRTRMQSAYTLACVLNAGIDLSRAQLECFVVV